MFVRFRRSIAGAKAFGKDRLILTVIYCAARCYPRPISKHSLAGCVSAVHGEQHQRRTEPFCPFRGSSNLFHFITVLAPSGCICAGLLSAIGASGAVTRKPKRCGFKHGCSTKRSMPFQGQFSFVHEFRNYRRPLLITAADIQKALGGSWEHSVFDRHGMTLAGVDGQSQRIRMRTHSTRHWKNALYDLGGMTDLQQTWAMHRKDARQTRVYQHRTVQEETDVMSRFLELTYAERATYLREAIRDGKIAGPLADAYETLNLNSPTEAESFLQTYASGVHITPWGICANDFTLSPCRKYLQCYDQCRHYHRTAQPEEQRRLEDLRIKMQRALDVMRLNAAGEAGGDTWVNMMETKLANLERSLAIVPRAPEFAPAQVFPRGLDRTRVSPKKSVL
jgi:hypothetical protein